MKTKVTADSPFNWTSQKHIKCTVEIRETYLEDEGYTINTGHH